MEPGSRWAAICLDQLGKGRWPIWTTFVNIEKHRREMLVLSTGRLLLQNNNPLDEAEEEEED